MTRGCGMRPAIQLSPRSTTTVEGADIGLGDHDARRQTGVDDAGRSSRCPFNLPISTAIPSPPPPAEHGSLPSTDCGLNVRPMHELDGPIGWPIVGNFLTYLKKENQGKMHEVQVSTTL